MKAYFLPTRFLFLSGAAALLALTGGCVHHGPHPTFIINYGPKSGVHVNKRPLVPTLVLNLPPSKAITRQVRTNAKADRTLNVKPGGDEAETPVVEINLDPADWPTTNNPGPHHIIVQTTRAGGQAQAEEEPDKDTLVIRFKGGYPTGTLNKEDLLNERPPPTPAP